MEILQSLSDNLGIDSFNIKPILSTITQMFTDLDFSLELVYWNELNKVKAQIITHLSNKFTTLGIDETNLHILSSSNLDNYVTQLMFGKEHDILEELKVEGFSSELISEEKSKRMFKYNNEVQHNLTAIIKKYNQELMKGLNLLKSFSTNKNPSKFYTRGQLASWTSSQKEAEYELQKKDNYYEYYTYSKKLINISADTTKFQVLRNIQNQMKITDLSIQIEDLSAHLVDKGFKLEFINILQSVLFYINIVSILNQFEEEDIDEVDEEAISPEQEMVINYLDREILFKINQENKWDILSEIDIRNFLDKKKAKANTSRLARFENKPDELQHTHGLMRSFNIGKLLQVDNMEEDILEPLMQEVLETVIDSDQEFDDLFGADMGDVMGEEDADEYDEW
mgnify:CR=1 FL=1